ncbi:hypothetical protein ACU4GD_26165 [Cupriavidus basilensis]
MTPEALEPGVILVGAANAKGIKSSYSNAGAVNWITGLGGEYGEKGAVRRRRLRADDLLDRPDRLRERI